MKRALFIAAGLGSLALAYACVGDDPSSTSAPPGDAGTGTETSVVDGGGNTDAISPATDAAPCDLSLEFSDLQPLTSLDGPADESGATLTADELQIIFSSTRDQASAPPGDGTDLWASTRASIDDPFDPATTTLTSTLNAVNKLDSDPVLSVDGLLLVWAQRQLEGGVNHVLRYATRSKPTDAFTISAPVSFLGDAGGGPGGTFPKGSSITGDGALYLAMEVTGDSVYRIFRASRGSGPGDFTTPVEQTLRSSGAPIHASTAVVSADEKTMYVGLTNGTESDIAVLKRPDTNGGWDPPQTLAKLSSGSIDEPRWLSRDGCRLYISSARPGAGGDDLYVARRK